MRAVTEAGAVLIAQDRLRQTGKAQRVWTLHHKGECDLTGREFDRREYLVLPLGDVPPALFEPLTVVDAVQEALF